MLNLTFDLETLGKTSEAPIVQIAGVKFNDAGETIDVFSRNIKLTSLERYSFYMDYDTIGWWFSQEDNAIKSVFCNDDAVDIRLALRDFQEWVGKSSEYYYWSHATFDPIILKNNLIKVGLKEFIPFRLHRDIRTLTHFAGKVECERKGIHHNALSDCLFQADYISKSIQILNNRK